MREIHVLRAIRSNRDVVDRDINVTGAESRDQTVKLQIADLDREAFLGGNRLDDIDVVADIFLRLQILRSKRRVRRIHRYRVNGLGFSFGADTKSGYYGKGTGE